MIEQVDQFKYLGAWITNDGRTEMEIKVRISIAKEAFCKRKEVVAKSFSTNLKKRIVTTLAWSVALYGAETWTIRKEDRRQLEALEMWIWRKKNKISWTEKKSNVEVLEMMGERRKLMETIVQRKKRWIGHMLRGESMLREVMGGKMVGKRARGRRRLTNDFQT